MPMEERLAALKAALNVHTNDEIRYSIGEKLRDLGYTGLADFLTAKPPASHLEEIEGLLTR